MNAAITVRVCDSLEDFNACVALQRDIWGEQDLDIEPASLFVVAAHTGGRVLGAYAGATLVGFTLALAAVRAGAPYLHSHMTGVHADYRDRGVGRMLKVFQRQEALHRGIRLIEWTFDPLEIRNAHFNLNRLGAICRRYLPDLYGVTSSPLHRGLATDRLVAEWHLESPWVVAALQDQQVTLPSCARVEIPPATQPGQARDMVELQEAQSSVRQQFLAVFSKGYAAVALEHGRGGSAYYDLVRGSDL